MMYDCVGCEDCPFINPNIPPYLHEIHLTVKAPKSLDHFYHACKVLVLKPIVLDLDSVMTDIMATFRVESQDRMDAMRIAEYKAMRLRNAGFKVIRIKIETTLTNPLVYQATEGYYESHLQVRVTSREHVDTLRALVKPLGYGHVSKNMFKDDTIMVTIRTYMMECALSKHVAKVREMGHIISEGGFYTAPKTINEFCWYDSNYEHDMRWIDG